MAVGDLITYSSFSTSYTGGQISDYDSQDNSRNDCIYCYVSSPSWWAQITINKNVGTWGRDWGMTANYYNGSSWQQAWTWSRSAGQFESGEWTYKFYHNSTLGTTSGDVSTAILWEIVFRMPELYRKRFWVYSGSIGCMGEAKYNTLCKASPTLIYSAGRLGSDSRHSNGKSQNRSDALSRFSQSANTGSPIYATHENKLVWAKYC